MPSGQHVHTGRLGKEEHHRQSHQENRKGGGQDRAGHPKEQPQHSQLLLLKLDREESDSVLQNGDSRAGEFSQ
jgi:hypothetical protein